MTIDTIGWSDIEPAAISKTARGMAEWLADAERAEVLAKGLVSGFFVPAAYKPEGNREQGREVAVANATGAILLGASLGLDPLTALQQIYIIHGRPGMYARAKAAIALAAGHEIWEEEYSADRAVVCGRRKGSQQVIRIVITMADAERAGWTNQNSNYAKTPADMLAARATSRVVDRICPDLLMGLASVEEIEPEHVQVVSIEETPRVSAAEHITMTPAKASEMAPKPVVAEDVPRLDPATWKSINARFAELRVQGPGQTASRLAVIGKIVGREVTRGSQLSEDEGRLVLANLAGEGGRSVVDHVLRGPAPDEEPTPIVDLPVDDPWAMDGAETTGEEL